ncbi:MAG: hypothetical protein WAV15_03830 [Minisyncoccia bacterium]
MEQETKNCQNCKKDFIIEFEDFNFYEKIKVPPPTFCPECRMTSRMIWRNERSLYKRDCDFCKKSIISVYSKDANFPVYCYECWWGDNWDPREYGQDYNFSKVFFEQLLELSTKVPRQALGVISNFNSPYLNYAWHSKNSYMCFDLGYGENVLYSNACHYLKDSSDNSYCKKLDLCYECADSQESSMSDTLEKCKNCLDSSFLFNCKSCSSCILCSNLTSKQYCILNKQYTKEEYEKIKKDYIDGSFAKRESTAKLFKQLKIESIQRENNNVQVKNCTGDNIWSSDNCKKSFNVFKSQNCKFVNDIDSSLKDSMDLSNAAEGELMYYSTSASGRSLFFNVFISSSFNIFYSILCPNNNNNLFACIGLRNKSYCILNKQYTKEEYEELIPKIKKHMDEMPYIDSRGLVYKYGEFFPREFSPFSYNETVAQENFPLNRDEAINQGYKWKDKDARNYAVEIMNENIPDNIKDATDDVIGKVIECKNKGENSEQCTEAFKIIEQEFYFYKRMNLPLPRFCPNCRHHERLGKRNPMKLWKRGCMCEKENHMHGSIKCEIEFETSYAPDRPEIIYCEKCYQQEVY